MKSAEIIVKYIIKCVVKCFIFLVLRSFSGIWRYPIGFAAGWALGEFVVAWRTRYLAERDAVLRQYVQLHPDDFKPISNSIGYLKNVFQVCTIIHFISISLFSL